MRCNTLLIDELNDLIQILNDEEPIRTLTSYRHFHKKIKEMQAELESMRDFYKGG